MRIKIIVCLLLLLFSFNLWAQAQPLQAITITPQAGGGQSYSVSIQILMIMTLLTFLPAILVTMTPFARILVVLAILRQGLGTQQTPSNQILIGIALFMTFFVMSPVTDQIYTQAVSPYMDGKIELMQALKEGKQPLRDFMMAQTRENDLTLFAELSQTGPYSTPDDVPLTVMLPAYVTSELKTAFQIGFMLLLPFLVIDLVIASVLMSMGMVMLSPLIISLPFKLMLFVLVDGWALILGTLASSFYI
ncbi:MAG: flagellar type III secretion system pore protein FliP [bacterium]